MEQAEQLCSHTLKRAVSLSTGNARQLCTLCTHPSVGMCMLIESLCEGGEWVQVVVLVGTGWSYMTPFLRDREKRILMVVIPLQVDPNSSLSTTHNYTL